MADDEKFDIDAFRKEIEIWAESVSPEARSAFASTSAARVLPNIAGTMHSKVRSIGAYDLSLVRSIITSAVMTKFTTPEVYFAAKSARRPVSVAANIAATAAENATESFKGETDPGSWEDTPQKVESFLLSKAAIASSRSSLAASAAIAANESAELAAVSAQNPNFSLEAICLSTMELIDRFDIQEPFVRNLWLNESWPEKIAENWNTLRTEWSAVPAMAFWIDWYEGLLEGRSPDWDLWHDIVLIDDEHWKAGPEAVAREIERIQYRLKTRVAPPVVFDKNQKKFHVSDDIDLPQEVWSFVKQRTDMALSNALSANSGNGLTETSYETQVIRAANDAPNATGSILATAYYDASLSLSQHIGDRYPDDPSLINLKNTLYAASEEICEQDEAARARCYRLSQLARPKPLRITEQSDAEEIAAELVKYSDDELAEILKSDASMIKRMQRAPKWVMARFSNYATTMAVWIDKAQKGDKRVAWLIKKIDELRDWWPDE